MQRAKKRRALPVLDAAVSIAPLLCSVQDGHHFLANVMIHLENPGYIEKRISCVPDRDFREPDRGEEMSSNMMSVRRLSCMTSV